MVKRKRKICLFSGKRGGLGAYLPFAQLIEKDRDLELLILLGDMHASKKLGRTVQEAKKYFPRAKIEVIEMGAGRGDTPLIRAENLGVCMTRAAQILEKLKPDMVMVHGDRGEHLMVTFAALNLGIPVGHTQGGEVSGNIDDIQRHAITKLAHLHFTETKEAARRLEKMGEEKWRIHPVGSVYIDRIKKKMYTEPKLVRQKYGLGPKEDFFIVIFHPETFLTRSQNHQNARAMFAALKDYGVRSVVTYPCSDPGYESVIKAIKEFEGDPQFLIYKNIDNLDFLGLMASAQALIGNSSCALVEAPYFKLPAINIGERQLGRDREENVIDCKPAKSQILEAIHYALTNQDFRKKLAACGYRLGDGRASEKNLKVIKRVSLDNRLLQKRLIC